MYDTSKKTCEIFLKILAQKESELFKYLKIWTRF